jgi:D-alanyl-D-alanine carboxypeptidase (penicillin-binding protein 5/6)
MMKMDLPRTAAHALGMALLLTFAAAALAADAPSADVSPGAADMTGDFASAIVVDVESGLTLVAHEPHQQRPPASMLKMLTELIVLEQIADGGMTLDDEVEVSAKASRMGGSQVYLAHGEKFTVHELLEALAIHSANDAAVALAEYVAGSTAAFVDLMNSRARRLGMKDSEFHSVHGLPPGRGQTSDLTTAWDMSLLARELIKHPEALEWSSQETAPFRDGEFTLYNPNKLVGKYRGLDGLKTGFTEDAGFCVTATAEQNGRRLVSVVMGCSTDRARATETTRLLTFGFDQFEQVPIIAAAGEPLLEKVAVKDGKQKEVALIYGEALTVSVPRARQGDLIIRNELPDKVPAPVAAGDAVGRAVVSLDGAELGSVPINAAAEVPRGNWLERLFH